MKRFLILTTLGVLPLAAGPAGAACVAVLPDAITCSGTAAGFTNAADGLTVTVLPGATVSRASSDGLRLRGTGVRVVNDGTIMGTGPESSPTDGIDGGNGLHVTNRGSVTGTNKGIDADGKTGVTILNSGTILATDKAIRIGDGAGARLENSGLIESLTDEGFEAGDNAVVVNHGTIRGSDDGVQVGENARIENYGLIESLRRGGADAADPQDGIDIDSGLIINHAGAVIRSDDDAAIDFDVALGEGWIENAGTIAGTIGVLTDTGNTTGQHITNSGAIIGSSGMALVLGAGDDSLRLLTGGTIEGASDFGSGNDRLEIFGDFLGAIAGGAVFDGGEGDDAVAFALVLAEVTRAVFAGPGEVTLALRGAGGDEFSIALRGWESFAFGDGTRSYAEMRAALAPVPLPAGALLLAGGLAGLAGLARRRRT